MMKRIISFLVVLSMLLSVAPMVVLAEDTAEPDLSGATLIEEIVFDEAFASSYMAQKVIYDNFSDSDGYDAIYSADGVAVTRIAEGTEDGKTLITNFAIRFTDYDKNEEYNTELYQQGFAGTYVFDFTINSNVTPVSGQNGTYDLYFSDYYDGKSITANRYQVKPSAGTFQSNGKTVKFSNINDNKDHKIRFVVDTVGKSIHGYEIDESTGEFKYLGTDAYSKKTDNSIRSLQFLFRNYVEKDSSVKIKKLDIYEVTRVATSVDRLPTFIVSDSKNITENITIPESLGGYTITSSDDTVLKADGTVIRGTEDKDVSLTVSGNADGITFEKIYHFTVKASTGSEGEGGGNEGGSGSEDGDDEGGNTPENPDDDTLDLTAGKLISNMNLNKEFAESSMGKIAIYDNFNPVTDGFETVYGDDGITIRRIAAEGDNDEKIDNFAVNFTALVDDDTNNSATVYQQGFKGIYAVEVTFCANYISSVNSRSDWYFSEYLNGATIVTGNDFRITKNRSLSWVTTNSDAVSLEKFTGGKDKTVRFVIDTDNGKSYIYEVGSNGNYTYVGEGTYTGGALTSFIQRFRASLDTGSYIKFKNVKLYEIKRSTQNDVDDALSEFVANVPEKITDAPNNVTGPVTIPAVPEGYAITATTDVIDVESGKVTRGLVDQNAQLMITNSVDGVSFKKIYDLVVKARDDVEFKNLDKYDFASEQDTNEFVTVGDVELTDAGYKISKTYGTNAQLIGMLKSEKYENTYVYDHAGVYDYEIEIIPNITSGRAYVEIGNYNSETGKFTTFGKFSVLSSGISQTTDTSNTVIVSEKTAGNPYVLKFRVDQGYEQCWTWVNDKIAPKSISYDGSGNTMNAYRISFDTTAQNGDSVTLVEGALSQWVNFGYQPVDNTLEVAKNINVDDILVDGTADDAYGSINLPQIDGYNMLWTTDNDLVDFDKNKIYRSFDDEDITIKLTISSISNPEVKVVKDFKLKVKGASLEDIDILLEGALAKVTAESVTNQNTSKIITDIVLPASTDDGYTLSWKSLNGNIINDKGVINKNAVISQDTEVTFEVTISYGEYSASPKPIKFTIAKRGLETKLNCNDLVEGVEGVVTYSSKIANNNGTVYLKDDKGNNIVGLEIKDSKVTLDYKGAEGAVIPVGGSDFKLEVVMNSTDKCASIFIDDVLVADYVPYIVAVNNFKSVDATTGIIISDNVVFDEYSLYDYNIKVFDYYDEFVKPYVTKDVVFAKDSIGGVLVEWVISEDAPVSAEGVYTPSFEVEFFDITLKLSNTNTNGAVYENKITLTAIPTEDENLLNKASASSNMRMDIVNNTNKLFDKNFKTYMEATLLGKNDYIIIDMGSVQTIGSLFFFQSIKDKGMLSCDIYLSEDGTDWSSKPVASPQFADGESNYVVFDKEDVRYIKITNISAKDKKIVLDEIKGYITYTADDAAYLDVMALNMPTERELKVSSLTLPTVGELYGSIMTWKSSDTSIISLDGKINVPSGRTEVVLTVTASNNGNTYSKSFTYYFSGKGNSGGGAGGSGGSSGGAGGSGGGYNGVVPSISLPVDTDIVQTPSVENLNTEFKDVKMNDWYYKYLVSLKETGIVNGSDDGNFYPDNFVKREEFLKMLVVAANIQLSDTFGGFEDVKADDWFAPYVYAAKENGIVNGMSENSFGVGMTISRQDMSVMIYNVLGIENDMVKNTEMFADDNNIADYAYNQVYAMKQLGLINGYENGEFNPSGNLTRAEATKVIFMLLEYLK